MSQTVYPTQNRYHDPNGQFAATPGSVYPQKYLSKISNQQFLRSLANNVVLKGLAPSLTYNNLIANISLSSGYVIHDDTLISITGPANLTFDVSAYGDTATTGSHLCVFSTFQYLETPDLNAQTSLVLTAYHVSSDGLTISGLPAYNETKNKILVGCFNFIKNITNTAITSLSETKFAATGISINGSTKYFRGFGEPNIFLYDLLLSQYSDFLNDRNFEALDHFQSA